jgi:hypothetical protein
MIIKILSKSATFSGIRYNTDKMDAGKGELVAARNFHALEGLENLRPQDYINYLETLSAQSSRIRYPQFHAVLSCKGREYAKEQLADLAENWLGGMGYGDNPYLLVFHKDTANNHLHIVTTRIGRDGKKINDSFEKLRSYEVLGRMMQKLDVPTRSADVAKSLQYSFSTHAQWMMILENMGYLIDRSGDHYTVRKHDRTMATVAVSAIDRIVSDHKKDMDRIRQLRAIVSRYEKLHNVAIRPIHQRPTDGQPGKITGYTSPLLDFLHTKFGIQAIFHFKEGKPPYGYTLIDHAKKQVFKGGDIRPLSEFREVATTVTTKESPKHPSKENATTETAYESPDKYPGPDRTHPISEESPGTTVRTELPAEITGPATEAPGLAMPNDIDDEAILGRNRRRKRKARTNTR